MEDRPALSDAALPQTHQEFDRGTKKLPRSGELYCRVITLTVTFRRWLTGLRLYDLPNFIE